MSNRLTISPELAAVVARARAAAEETGELRPASGVRALPLSDEVRAVLADWRASGDYDRAVAEIVADDPDLATQ